LLGGSVSLSELFSNSLSECQPALLSLKALVFDFSEVELADNESGWHDMVLIDVFNEGLDTSLFDEFLLVEASFSLNEVAGNTSD